MAEPIYRRVRGDGVQIQLAQWEGEKGPILCVHGLTANCRCWDRIASALIPHFRVMAMDLRGRGLSDKPPGGYSVEQHAKDIRELLDDLKISRAVLMGHSLGAFIALAFGALYPERVQALVLMDGGGKLTDSQRAKVFAGIRPSLERLGKVFPSFEEYVEVMKKTPFLQPWVPELDTYFSYEIEEVESGVRSRVNPLHIEEEVRNLQALDVSKFYPRVHCPVLILRATEGMLADDDLLLPQEVALDMSRSLPQARLVEVPRTNHYSILFHSHEERDRALISFLNDQQLPSS